MRPEVAPALEEGAGERVEQEGGDRLEEAAENRDEGGPTEEDEEAPAETGALADPAPEETPARPRRNRGGHRLFHGDNGDGRFSSFYFFYKKIS